MWVLTKIGTFLVFMLHFYFIYSRKSEATYARFFFHERGVLNFFFWKKKVPTYFGQTDKKHGKNNLELLRGHWLSFWSSTLNIFKGLLKFGATELKQLQGLREFAVLSKGLGWGGEGREGS